jgi:hypothetical protein
MTAYSYFGNHPVPNGFVIAILGEEKSEILIFKADGKN